MNSRWILVVLALAWAWSSARAAQQPCANPDALGTERSATVGDDGPQLGFKTYPHSLKLADYEVVLTFDDGPSPVTTPKVLAALSHECVHATFFLIGRNAATSGGLIKQELAEGHTVGHHSFSHPAATERGLAYEAARADIDRGFVADDKAAYGTAAAEPRVPFFRFPGFGDTPALDAWLASRHIAVFGADLWASDWVNMTPEVEEALLMRRVEAAGKGIILLHDIKQQTADMLPAFLRDLKSKGFKVVHLVPGTGPTAVDNAPAGWTSETEKTLAATLPKLLRHAGRLAVKIKS